MSWLEDGWRWVKRTNLYDTPDGKDCASKALHTGKVAGYLGSFCGAFDILGGRSAITGFFPRAARMIYFVGPAVSLGAVFASTACIAGDLRGKDGTLNHAIAGVATGCALSIHTGNWLHAVYGSFALACAGALVKGCYLNDLHIHAKKVNTMYGMTKMKHFGPSKEFQPPKEY